MTATEVTTPPIGHKPANNQSSRYIVIIRTVLVVLLLAECLKDVHNFLYLLFQKDLILSSSLEELGQASFHLLSAIFLFPHRVLVLFHEYVDTLIVVLLIIAVYGAFKVTINSPYLYKVVYGFMISWTLLFACICAFIFSLMRVKDGRAVLAMAIFLAADATGFYYIDKQFPFLSGVCEPHPQAKSPPSDTKHE